MSNSFSPHVLVVEDDPATARILTKVLTRVDPTISTDVVRDGSDCLEVLSGEHETIDRPDIVILDLNLMDVDGLEVLRNRAEADRRTPTVIVSGVEDSDTILNCYETGANTYFSKPDDLDGYLALAESIVEYWMERSELPSQHGVSC